MAILKDVKGLSAEDLRKLRSLRPGMPLDIQVSTPTNAKRVRTEFIGMDGNRTMMIRYPDETKWGNLSDAIYIDNSMIIRFILEDEAGEVVAFKTRVTFILLKPIHMIFVAFPVSIQSQGLRSEKRAQIRVPVSVIDAKTGNAMAMGTLMDISNSGCRIATLRNQTKKLAVNDIVIRLNGQDTDPFELKGSVMNVKQDEMYYSYGVKFSTAEEEVEMLISRLMVDL